MLLDQLTGGQLDWAPMDDKFDEVSLFVDSVEVLFSLCESAQLVKKGDGGVIFW